MSFLEVEVDDVVQGYVEDNEHGRHVADKFVQIALAYGAETARVRFVGNLTPMGANRLDR
jgi:hypothetical protein